MELERIKELVACCACREPMAGSEHVNMVQLARKATWESPSCGNLLTGYGPCALAFVCDRCLEAKREILVAVEFHGDGCGDEVIYHPVDELEKLPPEPTYVMIESRSGAPAIRCLRCGMVSFHPDDIEERYCGHCHEFHEPIMEETR